MPGQGEMRTESEYRRITEGLYAGSPMVFGCTVCMSPIWVPELYVAKPSRCPKCGGQWSRPDGAAEKMTP